MVKTNGRCAVSNPSSHGHLPPRIQLCVQGEQRELVAIGGHALPVSAVTAENQPAQFAGGLSPGIASRAPAEVEARPGIFCFVGPPIIELIPSRVPTEIEPLSIDRQRTNPHLAGVVPRLEYRQEPKMRECRAIPAMFPGNAAPGTLVRQFEGGQPASCFASFWVVHQFPVANLTRREGPRRDGLSRHDLPNHSRIWPPSARAKFQMTMKTLAPAIDPHHERVRCAPFIQ